MCQLAAEKTSNWLTVDPWEANSPTYIPTARVLDHVDYEINEVMGGIECADGTRKRSRIVLLAGLDLIQTMSTPGVWDERDLNHILNNYGVFAVERTGTETGSALANLKQWEHNIHIIRQVRFSGTVRGALFYSHSYRCRSLRMISAVPKFAYF